MTWRTDLLNRIRAAGDFGQLYEFERYGKNETDIAKHYVKNRELRGGYITMPGAQTNAEHSGYGQQRTVELTLFWHWSDERQSQLLFDSSIEQLMNDFNKNRVVGDWIVATNGSQVGWQLLSNVPAMFAGKLVHMAKLRITIYQP